MSTLARGNVWQTQLRGSKGASSSSGNPNLRENGVEYFIALPGHVAAAARQRRTGAQCGLDDQGCGQVRGVGHRHREPPEAFRSCGEACLQD